VFIYQDTLNDPVSPIRKVWFVNLVNLRCMWTIQLQEVQWYVEKIILENFRNSIATEIALFYSQQELADNWTYRNKYLQKIWRRTTMYS